MSDDKKTIERFTLLPNRYYIILEKVDEEQFTLSAYDTTQLDKGKPVPCAASVAQEGLLEMLDTQFDRVIALGSARMALRKQLDRKVDSEDSLDDNIIKIDFGKEQ